MLVFVHGCGFRCCFGSALSGFSCSSSWMDLSASSAFDPRDRVQTVQGLCLSWVVSMVENISTILRNKKTIPLNHSKVSHLRSISWIIRVGVEKHQMEGDFITGTGDTGTVARNCQCLVGCAVRKRP